MRRIIQNTTAIAACLSLLAPHAAMAQDATAEAAAAAAAEAAVETCEDGTQPPCAAPVEEVAPVEEPAAETAVEAEVVPEAAAAAEAVVEEVAPVEAEAAAEAEMTEPAPEAEAAAEAEVVEPAPAAEAEAEASAEPVVEETAPKAAAEPAAEAAAAQAAEDATNDAAVEAVEAPAAEAAATEAADPLADALAKEAEAAAATEADSKAEVTAEPKATPKTTATPEAAAEAEASAEAAGTTQTTPEANAVETEAAKEAAEVTAVPNAAALNDDAGKGEVTEEKVTEDNTRSSSEDFTTALRDALATSGTTSGEAPQAEANSDDGDDNDLTKALLLGLGGLAVGAMLNNNRQVALSTPDRVVVTRADGSQQIIKDEVALLRQPGSTVTTENFDDGSSRTTVTRADGSKVVTIRDADLRVLRRTLVSADGTTTRLIDDTAAQPVDLATLPAPAASAQAEVSQMSEDDLRAALRAESGVDRRFSLAQIRDIAQVRSLVAPVGIDAITFDTGSAAIDPDQAKKLTALGNVIRESVAENPGEVFLVEAYTDTVGSNAANLALSDRRAESVALALSEYFDVPPENLVVQGYGEQYLKVAQDGDIRENRRAAVRRITGLLQQSQ